VNCGQLHIAPEAWKQIRGEDGRVRAFCPNCHAFKGYVVPKEEPAKKSKPEKGK